VTIPRGRRRCRAWGLKPEVFILWVLAAGCGGPKLPFIPPPLPLPDATAIVNENISRIEGTLRAVGPVDGVFTMPEGRRYSYHLDGVLFFLQPAYVRFDLKKLGESQILLGSNPDWYWCSQSPEEDFFCGRQGHNEDWPVGLPARPDQLVSALGLTLIPSVGDSETQVVQRITDEFQEILFLRRGENGRTLIEKEYWLDRLPPQLIRRVVFRDPDGVVQMESILDEHRPLTPQGPLLPHRMSARWPGHGSTMRFDVRRWTTVPQIGPDAVQFATPPFCRDGEP
jgi:hypothetical protein